MKINMHKIYIAPDQSDLAAVPALESWRPPGASERPLSRGPKEAPKQAPPPPPSSGAS